PSCLGSSVAAGVSCKYSFKSLAVFKLVPSGDAFKLMAFHLQWRKAGWVHFEFVIDFKNAHFNRAAKVRLQQGWTTIDTGSNFLVVRIRLIPAHLGAASQIAFECLGRVCAEYPDFDIAASCECNLYQLQKTGVVVDCAIIDQRARIPGLP